MRQPYTGVVTWRMGGWDNAAGRKDKGPKEKWWLPEEGGDSRMEKAILRGRLRGGEMSFVRIMRNLRGSRNILVERPRNWLYKHSGE